MATITQREVLGGTTATLLSASDLGGLANNTNVVGATVYDNTAGSTITTTSGDGYTGGYLIFIPGGVFAAVPTANTGIDIYFLKSLDGGTTYEAGSSTITPTNLPAATLGFQASTAVADNTVSKYCTTPACKFKVLARNNATGQAIPSGSVVKFVPATYQGS